MEDPQAAERPDDGPEPPNQPDPQQMPLEDLAELIRSEGIPPPTQEPEAEVAEPEPEPTQPDQPAVEDTPQPDAAELRETQSRLEREQWQARYDKLEQHASRLAGKVGHLEKQLSGGQIDQVQSEPEEVSTLRAEFQELRGRMDEEASNRAIVEEFQTIAARPELQRLKLGDEIKTATATYEGKLRDVMAIRDPSQARSAAKEIAASIIMDAIALRMQKPAVTASNEARVVDRKLAVAASGASGSRVAARPRAPSPETMPLPDLKALIDKLSE